MGNMLSRVQVCQLLRVDQLGRVDHRFLVYLAVLVDPVSLDYLHRRENNLAVLAGLGYRDFQGDHFVLVILSRHFQNHGLELLFRLRDLSIQRDQVGLVDHFGCSNLDYHFVQEYRVVPCYQLGLVYPVDLDNLLDHPGIDDNYNRI